MTDVNPVQRYQQVMRQMLKGRKLAEWTIADDDRCVEVLDEIWWSLSEAEQEQLDAWVRAEIQAEIEADVGDLCAPFVNPGPH